MPSSEEVKAYFNGIAQEWDRIRQNYYGVEVIDKAAAAAQLRKPGTETLTGDARKTGLMAGLIVDVGCGTGFLSAGLAPLVQKVIGVDESAGMLEVAQQNMDRLGVKN